VQTRTAICGTGILLGLVLVLAHLPIILLIGPVIILFLGIIADPEETLVQVRDNFFNTVL